MARTSEHRTLEPTHITDEHVKSSYSGGSACVVLGRTTVIEGVEYIPIFDLKAVSATGEAYPSSERISGLTRVGEIPARALAARYLIAHHDERTQDVEGDDFYGAVGAIMLGDLRCHYNEAELVAFGKGAGDAQFDERLSAMRAILEAHPIPSIAQIARLDDLRLTDHDDLYDMSVA